MKKGDRQHFRKKVACPLFLSPFLCLLFLLYIKQREKYSMFSSAAALRVMLLPEDICYFQKRCVTTLRGLRHLSKTGRLQLRS